MSLEAKLVRRDDGTLALVAPRPAHWREAPRKGALVTPGAPLGRLEVLGTLHDLVAPAGAAGIVVDLYEPKLARRAVDAATVLVVLDPNAAGEAATLAGGAAASVATDGLVFRAPMSGRIYRRPAPTEPAFVEVGQEVALGQTVCLLEVMKTFNRITYGGDGLPERAKVKAVVAEDGADLDGGDVILVLEG
ncbi:MAG: hypothetical protein KF901_23645 [Myxococcales bacterium]|nr:hypothetical protein [Myxococcales bacterium]